MEVDENEVKMPNKGHENGSHHIKNISKQDKKKEISDHKNSKANICNGDNINGKDDTVENEEVMENGVCEKNSEVDSNSNLDSKEEVKLSEDMESGDDQVSGPTKNGSSDPGDLGGALDLSKTLKNSATNSSKDEDSDNMDEGNELSENPTKESDVGSPASSDEKLSKDENDCVEMSEDINGEIEKDHDETEETIELDGPSENADIKDHHTEKTRTKEDSADKSDSEKENESKGPPSRIPKDMRDSSDDVEFIGESKLIKIDSPSMANSPTQNVILLAPGMNNNFSPMPSMGSPNSFSPGMPMVNLPPGFMMNGGRGVASSPLSLVQGSSVAPPKPKSSLDQIELIRWEIQNRLNTRPKYFKPNPSAELGPLAKFLFDIGSNLIKEAVYHELVKIQSKKNDENTLSEKEKDDLGKLKDIEKELHATIGHLKLKMKKRCKTCNFQTEFSNVLYHHKQFPHEDNKNLQCAHCTFTTKQPMTFKFHIESEHGIQPRLYDRKAFYECDLCPYENNQEQKLTVHKQRCTKQFRPLFNLHPSCLSGAEINLCLENIFYKPVIPKNLKILQQKHAQQQAALAEARRQQAEVQALAAQKNAAALAAKQQLKQQQQQQQQQQRHIVPTPQRFNPANSPQFSGRAQGPTMPTVRYNSRSPAHTVRPTVASMLKDKHPRQSPHSSHSQNNSNSAPGGFEVCEICGGYVKDRKALRIHFFYAHRIDLPFNLFDRNQPPLYCATCYVRFWTAQGLRKHIDVHVQEKKVPDNFMGEGVHGKCISCGQLVGNIVVHMRVVHNREIHHYINASMCMFCGASFNSRSNVERHITDVHGTIDIATGAVKVKAKLKSSPQPPRQQSNPRKSGGGKDNLVKGSVCVLCNLNFGRNVDLTRHCMRMHHTCMKCGMVVIDKASLLKHTCLSSPSGTRDCSMCDETGFHPAYYVKHLRDKHLRKFSITVARVSAPIIEKWIKRPYPFKSGQNDPVEISDSEEEEVVTVEPPPKVEPQNNTPEPDGVPRKKARIGPASKIGRPFLGADKEENGKAQDITSPLGPGKRKSSIESTPERMSKRRK